MHFLRKIIFLLLFMISFSCKTRLEKQGWLRTAVVSQLDTSTINKKDKELIVVHFQDENVLTTKDSTGEIIKKPFLIQDKNPVYVFNAFFKDSVGKIINEPFPFTTPGSFKSDLAYYKWDSDSLCRVMILNHGNVQASYELIRSHNRRAFRKVNEPKK